MKNIINSLSYKLYGKPFYSLSKFNIVKHGIDNVKNKNSGSVVTYKLYNNVFNNQQIGECKTNLLTGEINNIEIVHEYRGLGLGKELLKLVCKDRIKHFNNNILWCTTHYNNSFFNKLDNSTWRHNISFHRCGNGYQFKLKL